MGATRLARSLGLRSDFSGCYVLLENEVPQYVGISRKVLMRLRQHVRGKTHFDASLAYAMAKKECAAAGSRSAAMSQPRFIEAFKRAQSYLMRLDVAYVQIENSLELYVFEAYAAMTLNTHKWNTFRTH
jgi:hypothetical protein